MKTFIRWIYNFIINNIIYLLFILGISLTKYGLSNGRLAGYISLIFTLYFGYLIGCMRIK